jgi:hypothetical protein
MKMEAADPPKCLRLSTTAHIVSSCNTVIVMFTTG